MAAQRARIAQLRKQGKNDQAKEVAARLRAMIKRYGDPEKGSGADARSTTADRADISNLVKQAYLRTVSRYPTDAEQRRAVEYIEAADNPASGLRDLLWALINTKEFIVNH